MVRGRYDRRSSRIRSPGVAVRLLTLHILIQKGTILDHSFEEIRSVALDLLAGRERGPYDLNQYQHFLMPVPTLLIFFTTAGRTARSQSTI